MKIVKYISVILLLLFAVALVHCAKEDKIASTSVEQDIEYRSTYPNCLPTLKPGCIQYDTVNLEIQLSQFPGCTFEVQYALQQCYLGDNTWEYNFSMIRVIYHDCEDYNAMVDSLSGWRLEDFVVKFNKWVQDAVLQYHLVNEIQVAGGTRVMASYYFASCSKICWVKISGKPGPPKPLRNSESELRGNGGGNVGSGGFEALVGLEFGCGENCCALSKEFAFVNGDWDLVKSEIVGPEDPCEGALPVDCPPESIFSTDCFTQCVDESP